MSHPQVSGGGRKPKRRGNKVHNVEHSDQSEMTDDEPVFMVSGRVGSKRQYFANLKFHQPEGVELS